MLIYLEAMSNLTGGLALTLIVGCKWKGSRGRRQEDGSESDLDFSKFSFLPTLMLQNSLILAGRRR